MELEESVRSRAYRTLRALDNYIPISGTDTTVPEYLSEIPLQENEAVVGVYENTPRARHEAVVVTTLGLYVFRDGNWTFLRYHEIVGIDTPEEKVAVDGLTVHLASGVSAWLPVKGRKGKFRDVFEFLRFLRRVLQHIERRG